ncbi:hypothetical protein CHCC15292_4570 [Bacillus licheniformis]|nr:hypothetical protein CHCC5019_4190 [Bacillus paralicheniformis]TWJ94293.1 hypothetical protein CHCC20493_0453 [Bacillus licheniformis]TWL93765.1 hypothetical protein CHCC15292_4570 [Bacillus licheniformis]
MGSFLFLIIFLLFLVLMPQILFWISVTINFRDHWVFDIQ